MGSKEGLNEIIKEIFVWISNNEKAISIVFTVLSSIGNMIWAIANFFVSKRNKKKEEKQEQLFKVEEIKLQQMQQRIETFQYKEDIYETAHKISQLAEQIQITCKSDKLNIKGRQELFEHLNRLLVEFHIDSKKVKYYQEKCYIVFSSQEINRAFSCIFGYYEALTEDINEMKKELPNRSWEENCLSMEINEICYLCDKIKNEKQIVLRIGIFEMGIN